MKTIYDTGKRTSELLQDLKQLVEIPSVRDERTAGISAPFGKEIRNAMDVFLQIAQREGFSVHDFDGYAVDAQLGEGDDYIGVLAHLDVVEAGERSHWHGDPFQMREIDGMLYGRGVNDDKGPLLAALYAMARIRQEGRTLYHPIRLIAGGAEETTWECMEHYFKHNPQPICGFSPDGNFPIVNGEKGILQVRFLLNADSDISLHCKERLHIVCDDLQVIVPKGSDVSFVERTNLIEVMQDGIKITYRGVRALSRNPQRGDNAIFKFVKDFHGHLDQASSLYPSTDEQSLLHTLRKTAQHYGCELEVLRHKRLLYVAEDSTLIQSLKTAYHRVMKEDAAVFTKGGASYARVLDHGVAFGATFPDEDPRPHMPNECMPVKSLLKASDIYYEALVELACTKR